MAGRHPSSQLAVARAARRKEISRCAWDGRGVVHLPWVGATLRRGLWGDGGAPFAFGAAALLAHGGRACVGDVIPILDDRTVQSFAHRLPGIVARGLAAVCV